MLLQEKQQSLLEKYGIYHLFLCYLNCVLSITVLLEDEHLLQSEIHSALEQPYHQGCLRMVLHCSFYHP